MSDNGFTVRLAQGSDVSDIISLVKASWARTYDPVIGEEERRRLSDKKHVASLFIREIEDGDACGLVAVDDAGKIIGHVGGDIRGRATFFVDHLHVEPTWHGKGVSSELITNLAVEVKHLCDQIELTVLENNHRAVAFYKKAGFVEATGDNEDDGLADVSSQLMRLAI